MTKNDRLYKESLRRFGPEEMAGIDSLLEAGHTGIAERHAVQKMILYVRSLEDQLGIDVPKIDRSTDIAGIKINSGESSFFL